MTLKLLYRTVQRIIRKLEESLISEWHSNYSSLFEQERTRKIFFSAKRKIDISDRVKKNSIDVQM